MMNYHPDRSIPALRPMVYAIVTLFLAALLTVSAVTLGPWGYSLLWFTVCAIALTIGYARPGTNIFRKSCDGTIPLPVKILFLPLFLYMWSMWHLFRKVSHERPFDQVSANLLVGRRLLTAELPEKVHNYLDLTMEFEDPPAIRRVTNYICLPILNGGLPSQAAIRYAFDRLENGPTYIHCARGHSRTALAALCLLAQRNTITGMEDGLTLLKKVRPSMHLNSGQRHFVKQFIERRHMSSPLDSERDGHRM